MKDSINTWSRNTAFAFILTHTHTQNKKGKRGKERKGKERREGKKDLSLVLRGVGLAYWKRETKKNKKKKDFVLWKEIAEERSRREKGCSLYLSLSLSHKSQFDSIEEEEEGQE